MLFKKILKWIKGEEESLTAISEAILDWNKLGLSEDSLIRSFADIHPYISPVSEYIGVIDRAAGCMRNEIEFYPPKSNTGVIKKRKFFLTSNGNFLEPVYALTRLTHAATDLLQRYEDKQNLLEKTKADSTNISRLLPIVNNLIHLAKELSEETS